MILPLYALTTMGDEYGLLQIHKTPDVAHNHWTAHPPPPLEDIQDV